MNKELKKKIKEFEKYLTSAKPAPTKEIVDTYNEFKGNARKSSYTSCGSCLRRMVVEMVNALKDEMKKARLAKEKKEKEQKEE